MSQNRWFLSVVCTVVSHSILRKMNYAFAILQCYVSAI